MNGTVNEATQRMTIKATSTENDYSKNTVLITSKVGIWELLISFFKQHYRNECTTADNLEQPSLPIVTQWMKKD